MNIKIRAIKELHILYERSITFESVFNIFEEYPEDIIYVLKDTNNCFVGIIELDDFCKNRNDRTKWINKKCEMVCQAENEKDIVKSLLKNNSNIKQVSIIDDTKQLLYEYVVDDIKALNEQIILQNRWNEIGENNQRLIIGYLVKHGIRKLVIYGNDELALRLYGTLKDRLKVSLLSRIEEDSIKDKDLIIMCGFNRMRLWRLNHSKYKANILMLSKLISNVLNLKSFNSTLMDKILKSKNKNVEFYFFESPITDKIKNLSYEEEQRTKGLSYYGDDVFEKVVGNPSSPNYLGNKEQDIGYSVISNGKYNVISDFRGKYYNVVNGRRITINQPKEYDCTIYVFGPCTIRGALVEDVCTIPSYLQRIINSETHHKIKVENCGVGGGSDLNNDLKYIDSINLKENDIIIIFEEVEEIRKLCEGKGINWRETSSIFNRPHKYGEWFLDRPVHCNFKANEAIARRMFDEVVKNRKECSFDTKKSLEKADKKLKIQENTDDKVFSDSEDLAKYLNYLEKFQLDLRDNFRIGAVVMNCNPFTLGHRYLIEQAKAQVDFLYVFVVEEDKAMFSFKERFKLVEAGTSDLLNVKVITSGLIMASTLTFPEYFNRATQPIVEIDASKDIQVFAQHVVPKLGIDVRFVGHEPFDYITNQYNQQLKELLPLYGVEIVEISRKTISDVPVSASKVRRFLEAKEWNKIKELVPISTYQYLFENFNK